ncbi:MAG: hypothetical protein PHO41_09225 [Eubacteriales bacterium]|nr:hypothetical protein [Eubacteriales bacterium]
MTSNNRPNDPSDRGGASLRLPPLKLQASPRQQPTPQVPAAKKREQAPAMQSRQENMPHAKEKRQPVSAPQEQRNAPPVSQQQTRMQPAREQRQPVPAPQEQRNAPPVNQQQARMQPAREQRQDAPQEPQKKPSRPCGANCPTLRSAQANQSCNPSEQGGIVQPPVVSGQEPPCKSPVSAEILQRAKSLFPADAHAAIPVNAQAQRFIQQGPGPVMPQQRYPLQQGPGPVMPQARRPMQQGPGPVMPQQRYPLPQEPGPAMPQGFNPFPRIFPGARFRRMRAANGMTVLEGSSQNNGAPIRILAVPGEWAELPPSYLPGFDRYVRTPDGGYWVMIQGL